MSHLRITGPVPIDWKLHKHITSPTQQGTCVGLPRKNGPKPQRNLPVVYRPDRDRAMRAVRPNKDTGYYGVVPTSNGRYRVVFAVGLETHNAGTFTDVDAAAHAHDAYVTAWGIDRPLNFEAEAVGDTTLEEAG